VREPEATFSTCFGAPFMPRHPLVYGNILHDLITQNHVDCWLLNTGWTGGKKRVCQRAAVRGTRRPLAAPPGGGLTRMPFHTEPYFGLAVPTMAPGVEPELLKTIKTWESKEDYEATAKELAYMFRDNFVKFE